MTFSKIHKLVFVSFLFFLISNLEMKAQGPNAPEAGAFEPIDATDMVNLVTGDLTYVLPLLNVPSPEGGYPVALTYHAGIAIDQEASWVGLGWNLNPGALNRSVNGYPDDWKSVSVLEKFIDVGGSEEDVSISVNYTHLASQISIGASVAQNSNKGFGGSVSVGFGVGDLYGVDASIGIQPGGQFNASIGGSAGFEESGFTISGSAGSYGVGVNLGYKWLDKNATLYKSSLGFNHDLNGGFSVSGNFNVGSGIKSSGIGLSFSSQGLSVRTKISGVGVGSNFGFNNSIPQLNYNIERTSKSFSVFLPVPIPGAEGVVTVGYKKNKIKWGLNTTENTIVSSALYLNEAYKYRCKLSIDHNEYDEITQVTTFVNDPSDCNCSNFISPTITCLDVIEVSSEPINHEDFLMDVNEIGLEESSKNLENNNAILPSYDFYSVNAQGLSGNILPRMYENGALMGLSRDFKNENDSEFKISYRAPQESWQNNFANFQNDIHFYFENEYSSSLVVDKVNFLNNPNSNDIFDYINPNSPNTSASRKKDGRFVEVFTNLQILNGDANIAGLILPTNERSIPADGGIGAFKITSLDGKTYHYSLPVYNYEVVTRIIGNVKRNGSVLPERESYFEKQQGTPFASHWLLTAVTGSDYIDMNNNNQVDNNDFGYWVAFDYGKWSDAFVWKSPHNKDYDIDESNPDIKTVTHGIKDVYYLDKISTRTHTALFVKNARNDSRSPSWEYRALLGAFPNSSQFDTPRFSIPPQNPLRLDKIILVKNENDTTLKNSGSGLNSYGSVTIDIPSTSNREAQYNISDNVLDVNDQIEATLNRAIKVIDLGANYSYDLVKNTPNADSGKLTLNGVGYKGKNNNSFMPSYSFGYSNNLDFNQEEKNEWGYYHLVEDAWSLNTIISPVGGKIKIDYESDSFQTAIPQQKINFNGDNLEEGKARFEGVEVINGQDYGLYRIVTGKEINLLEANNIVIEHLSQTCEGDNNNGVERIIEYEGSGTILNGGNGSFIIRSSNPILFEIDPNTDCDGQYHDSLDIKLEIGFGIHNGSGLRVKSIAIDDMNTLVSKTMYDYNLPGTTNTSGIISYFPFAKGVDDAVPYGSLLPSPMTMYKYVSVKKLIENNPMVYSHKTQYKFKVLDSKDDDRIRFGDLFEIVVEPQFDITNGSFNVEAEYVNIIDNLACLGQLEEITQTNSENQILEYRKNTHASRDQINQGVIKESFQAYKIVDYTASLYTDKWLLNSTSKTNYPSVLLNSMVQSKGQLSTTYFGSYDFVTGQPLETTSISSDGDMFKTKVVPAYHIDAYSPSGGYGMGSKVDDISNKNMLTQEAASFSYKVLPDGSERLMGAGITTWDNSWKYLSDSGNGVMDTSLPAFYDRIWRKESDYVWKGNLRSDGSYSNFVGDFDGFDWGLGATSDNQPEQWQEVSKTTLYDHYSMPLETKDINDNYASTRMSDGESKILSVANARYGEQVYSGLENDDIDGIYYSDSQVVGKSRRSTEKSHTGMYSAQLYSSNDDGATAYGGILRPGMYRPGMYRFSVWVHKDNYQNARFITSYNGSKQQFTGEKVFAGDWVQLNHYFNLTSSSLNRLFAVLPSSGVLYADDLRVHPIQSSMSSYVYNDWDELTHIIGSNNMATRYEYDDGGRLKYTYVEVADTPTVPGGFKLAAEYNQNYKRGLSDGSGDNEFAVYFSNLEGDCGPAPATALLHGPANAVVQVSLTKGTPSSTVTGTATGISTGQSSGTVTIPSDGSPVPVSVRFNSGTNGSCQDCEGIVTYTIIGSSLGVPETQGLGTTTSFGDQDWESCGTACNTCDSNDPPPSISANIINENSVSGSPPNCTGQYLSSVSGVSGGSGNYSYTWYRILNGGSPVLMSGVTGTSATYSYNPLASGCGGTIKFRCRIDDNQSTLSNTFTSPQRSINCSCNQQ